MRVAVALVVLGAAVAGAAPMVDLEGSGESPEDSYCQCSYRDVYLDIAVIADVSADMTQKEVNDASATIGTVLYSLTHGTAFYQSNVATVVFADTVQVTNYFGSITHGNSLSFQLPYLGGKATKMAEAIETAASLLAANARSFTRGVILLFSKSYSQLDSANIIRASEEFQSNDGIVITIDYAANVLALKGLADIASPGYALNNTDDYKDFLIPNILQGFCDANCLCAEGDLPYNVTNEIGREIPLGCYHQSDSAAIYEAAEVNCVDRSRGFVATVHDSSKNYFLATLFGSKKYWLGLRTDYYKNVIWADNSTAPFVNWAPSNPLPTSCAYATRTVGLNSQWFSADCADPFKSFNYACQLRPCDSTYDCRPNNE